MIIKLGGLTRVERLIVLLAAGVSLGNAAAHAGLPQHEAHRLAVAAGWPDCDAITKAAAQIRADNPAEGDAMASNDVEEAMVAGAARTQKAVEAMAHEVAESRDYPRLIDQRQRDRAAALREAAEVSYPCQLTVSELTALAEWILQEEQT